MVGREDIEFVGSEDNLLEIWAHEKEISIESIIGEN